MKPNLDQVTEAYIQTRNAIKELEDKISELKVYQARKEEYMMSLLTEAGATSIKTEHGTIYTLTKESITVSDAETFFNWVKENDRFDCLERRAAKTAVLEIMGDREDSGRPNPPPPGLSYVSIKGLGIRKAS